MSLARLTAHATPQGSAAWPNYAPEARGRGIVHLGLGNFARAHLVAYTDRAMGTAGGDWRITGVSLRGTEVAQSLNPQNGRYTLITRGAEISGQVIGALAQVLAGADVGALALRAMSHADCRIVSLTVSEKGYGLTSAGALDRSHPAVQRDLKTPQAPVGVLGLICAALFVRRRLGIGAFTALSCDNLAHNGQKLRAGVLAFAAEAYGAEFADWIAAEARFPSTMVDRITPAATQATRQDARSLTGYTDAAAVETEPFSQWVIEDDFCAGRPAWEQAGAVFVKDVQPYENMKLRMLNGAHSMLAYSGQLAGRTYVRDVMAHPSHAALVRRHLEAAAQTVTGLELDLADYARALEARFANPAIAHATAQIAMDGSQKLPQRITAPALAALSAGQDARPFAFALASWLAFVARRDGAGQPILLNDPKAEALAKAAAAPDPAGLLAAVAKICPDILPAQLIGSGFGQTLRGILSAIQTEGIAAAIEAEATRQA